MCQSQRKALWTYAMMCCYTTVHNKIMNSRVWNLHKWFRFTTFTQSWLLKFYLSVVERFWQFIKFRTVKNILSAKGDVFDIVLLQIHSGSCLQKISVLDLRLIQLLKKQKGCNFLRLTVYVCAIVHIIYRTVNFGTTEACIR